MKSPCYIPEEREGWWGGPDKRLRCRADDKVVFATELDAQRAAAKATARGEQCTAIADAVVTCTSQGQGGSANEPAPLY